jgi:hypothetical protein
LDVVSAGWTGACATSTGTVIARRGGASITVLSQAPAAKVSTRPNAIAVDLSLIGRDPGRRRRAVPAY